MKTNAMVMVLCFTMFSLTGCNGGGGGPSCTPRGDSCSDSYECCGSDICVNHKCVVEAPGCTATGDYCMNHADCCNFQQGSGWCVDSICKDSCTSNAECMSYCCAPTSIAGVSTCADSSYCPSCLPVNSACSNAAQCCGLMLCEASPYALSCCVQQGLACSAHSDCCGTMLCNYGTCG